MTKYIVEAHYGDGSRELFGDPLFEDAPAAVTFGEKLLSTAVPPELRKALGLVLDYAVVPVNHGLR